jgi:hypothetical protein
MSLVCFVRAALLAAMGLLVSSNAAAWGESMSPRHAGPTPAGQLALDEHGHPILQCGGGDWPGEQGFADAVLRYANQTAIERAPRAKAAGDRLFEVVYLDASGTGFLDPTPVAPLPGNPATTLGEQRKAALQAALDIWAMRLDSAVPLRIGLRFSDLGCSAAGMAGPTDWAEGVAGMPLADASYPSPLIAARTGLRPGNTTLDLVVQFNSALPDQPCFQAIVPDGLWYGLDRYQPSPLTAYSFLDLALHEIGHGLGFVGLVQTDGTMPGGLGSLDVFSRHFYSASRQRTFADMSAQERAASLALPGDVLWDGASVKQRLGEVLGAPRELRATVNAQALAWPAFSHEFVPYRMAPGMSARLQSARNDTGVPSTDGAARNARDACEALLDAPLPPDTALLVQAGGCDYNLKWRHAYAAGAIALLVVDTREPEDPRSAARSGLALRERHGIPLWTVGPSAGQALWPLAAEGRVVELGFVPGAAPNGTREGRMPMRNAGHFGHPTDRRLVMSIRQFSDGRFGFTDLTADALYDIGWPRPDVRRSLYVGAWYQPARSGEGCVLSLEGVDGLFAMTCYFHRQGEQIWVLGVAELRGDALDFAPVQITRGTGYGSAFDPASVVRETFGRMRLSLSDCNHGVLDVWPELPGLEPFQVPIQKVVSGDCQRASSALPDAGLSGSYFDPERSGEGIQIAIEAAGGLASLAWYTYRDGRQMWAAGAGTIENGRLRITDAVMAAGADFGRRFDPADVERTRFGEFELQWLDCNRVEVRIRPILPGLEDTHRVLQRVAERNC